jgi:hypothetical protein
MPAIDHVEFDADLITNAAWDSSFVKDAVESVSRIQFPVRVDGVLIQIQDGAQVVVEDYVDIETTSYAIELTLARVNYKRIK